MGFQITASLAILILSTQAAVQVAAYAQYGGQNWTGATTSTSSKPPTTITTSTTSKATTTTQAPGGGGGIVTPTKVTTTFPFTISETMLPSATVISGTETGEQDTIFILEDGATLANVIIGKNQVEGVHCRGTCTLINVWHEEVCEDAMTNADDKIMQFNGRGIVFVKYFYAENFGKVMRHFSTFEGLVAKGGGVVVGINTNYGDKASLVDSCITGGTKYSDRYTGVTSNKPKKIGLCPDDTSCP
ncbi:pectin lyase fold/virulence factor [Leptodontidium sp. MPI-SDFR-AT-0119]|nr:pectin lyase fold/virulence factor [Leptodontidium sp. MPI-SDFR-AT-0119]